MGYQDMRKQLRSPVSALLDHARRIGFQLSVQTEVKAQCDDQALVNTTCTTMDGMALIDAQRRRLAGVPKKTAAFLTAVAVLAWNLERADLPLTDKIRIATLLNDRTARVRRNQLFYTSNADLFLSAQQVMHSFCLHHNLNPERLVSAAA